MNGLERWLHGTLFYNKQEPKTYYCPACKRNLLVLAGVVTHDEVPHPDDLVFEPDAEGGAQ